MSEPELPDFLKQLFSAISADDTGSARKKAAVARMQSALLHGFVENPGFMGSGKGLVIGLRRDVFSPQDRARFDKSEHEKAQSMTPLRGPFGFTVSRVAFRKTANGLEQVSDDEMAKLMQPDASEDETFDEIGRLLMAGEEPESAFGRAARAALILADDRGVQDCRLFADIQNGVKFDQIPDLRGMSPYHLVNLSHSFAALAAIMHDKNIVQSQELPISHTGRVWLAALTEATGLGHAVHMSEDQDNATFGMSWLPDWKLVAPINRKHNEDAIFQRLTTVRIMEHGKQLYTGALTPQVFREVLIPVVVRSAERFLGADCQWPQGARMLEEIARSPLDEAGWISANLPLQLPHLPPFTLEA